MKLFGGRGARNGGRKNGFSSLANALGEFFEKKSVRVIVIILAVLSVSAAGATAAWKTTVKPPELPVNNIEHSINIPTFDMGEQLKTPDTEAQNTVQTLSDRKPGCYTVLLVGVQGNGDLNTDTLMVGTLDTERKSLDVVSIPRDTMVNVKRDVKKINAAYAMGNRNGKEEGILQLKTELKSILGFMPDFYAIVNMKGFVKLVDTMGGVTYDVPEKMYKNTGDMIINLQKGKQKLTGQQALQLVRYRGYAGKDDYGRMETQQNFLKTVAKQLITLGNLFKINEFVDIAKENLTTDLEVTDMLWFGQELLAYGTDSITFHTLPSTAGYYNGVAYVFVNEEETIKLINETINPFSRDITTDDLNVLKVN